MLSTPIGGCEVKPLSTVGSPMLSQQELNHLLDLEEDAYFESRRQMPKKEGARHDWREDCESKVSAPYELMRILDLEQEAYFGSKEDSGCDVAEGSAATGPTTLMVRNISWKLTAAQVREHLHELGFEDTYDFFHLPIFRTGRANQGYFFVNFKTWTSARSFEAQLQGRAFGAGAKLCDVAVAEWQGLDELRARFTGKFNKARCRRRMAGLQELCESFAGMSPPPVVV
jgi:hypothetical protein